MNPVLEDRYARVLHFLAWKKPLPHYLTSTKMRVINTLDSGGAVLFDDNAPIARCREDRGIEFMWRPVMHTNNHKILRAAKEAFGDEPPEVPLGGGLVFVTILGPLGLAAYRATWRTRLKHQKVRQPW